jgi:hypothetical protein
MNIGKNGKHSFSAIKIIDAGGAQHRGPQGQRAHSQ